MDRNNEYRMRLTTVSGLDDEKVRDDKVLPAKFLKMIGGFVISFSDRDEEGETHTVIKIKTEQEPATVTVKRKGLVESEMKFCQGETDEFDYNTPMGVLKFSLKTDTVSIEEKDTSFGLELAYSLYSGSGANEETKVSENRLGICILF